MKLHTLSTVDLTRLCTRK